jgi:Tfp pilus assembly protein PilO
MTFAFPSLFRRYPFRTACVVVTVIAAGASWFLWEKASELETAHYVRSQEGESLIMMLVAGPSLRQEMALTRDTAKRIEDHLVIEDNLTDNLAYFYRIEEQTKAKLSELRQLPSGLPETSAAYRRVPFSLRVSGTYAQVVAFLQAIETGPRLSDISSFSFRRQGPNSPMITLDLKLVLLGKR